MFIVKYSTLMVCVSFINTKRIRSFMEKLFYLPVAFELLYIMFHTYLQPKMFTGNDKKTTETFTFLENQTKPSISALW